MITTKIVSLMVTVLLMAAPDVGAELTYPVVDTGQERCYDIWREINYSANGSALCGQDAQYRGLEPAYRDNGDGTVSDLNTGLMWEADPGRKKRYAEAVAGASACRTGGYRDWRLPTIKELYSLILFSGTDPDPSRRSEARDTPFIDTRFFKFQYGKASDGDRIIDSQWATSTLYVGRVMDGARAMFGVNFADGRIKGYPVDGHGPRGAKRFYAIYVRGHADYGKNDFEDNGDGTVTDRATGLTWMKADSGRGMDWSSALLYAQKMDYAGYADWRLPNAKELQSIVDYSRSPDTTQSAAIDPVFQCTPIRNEADQRDYGHYWTSTSHVNQHGANRAVTIAFGRALGYMDGHWMDVHGAGAQRSDVKSGDESQHPQGLGPQGDAQRVNNYVRLVRGGRADPWSSGPAVTANNTRGRQTVSSGENRPAQMQRTMVRQRGMQQGDTRPGDAPHDGGFVAHCDKNGDGKVSPEEFDGPVDHFPYLDKNNDGYLTEDEAPPPRNHHSRPPEREKR